MEYKNKNSRSPEWQNTYKDEEQNYRKEYLQKMNSCQRSLEPCVDDLGLRVSVNWGQWSLDSGTARWWSPVKSGTRSLEGAARKIEKRRKGKCRRFEPGGVPRPTSKLSPRAPAQMGRRETEHEGGKKPEGDRRTKVKPAAFVFVPRPGRVRLQ
jgi:hypothetical protein